MVASVAQSDGGTSRMPRLVAGLNAPCVALHNFQWGS